MNIKILFVVLLLQYSTNIYSKETKHKHNLTQSKVNNRYIQVGIGLPSIYFRDNTSSQLAYKGSGLLAFHFAGSKQIQHKFYREWNFQARFQEAKPDINNISHWNKLASIYMVSFMYKKLKEIQLPRARSWNFYAGASLGSNLQLAVIPAVNNTLAYNLSWLQLGLEAMIKRDISIKGQHMQFTNQTSLPIFGVNTRPLSYVGLPPQEIIWSQNSSIGASLFTHPKLFSLHNNIALCNNISVDHLRKKSKIGLCYSWLYQYNTVAINSLNSIMSCISINYSIQLKNK